MSLHFRRSDRRIASAVAIVLLSLFSLCAQSDDPTEIDLARTVVLFYSDDCPHCHAEIAWLNAVQADFPALEILAFEIGVSNDAFAQQLFSETMEALGSNTSAWPRTVIGDEVYIGFAPGRGKKIWSAPHRAFIGYENRLYEAMAELNTRAGGAAVSPEMGAGAEAPLIVPAFVVSSGIPVGILAILVVGLAVVVVLSRRFPPDSVRRRYLWGGYFLFAIAALFLLIAQIPDSGITALAERVPFPFFVAIIAIADGFNPCAFAVLCILLSLLTYTRSRRRMALLGGTFITTSAVMYGVMILLLVAFGAFLLSRVGTVLFRILGGVVFVFGLVNGIDWIRKRAPQLALSAEQKSSFGRRAAAIVERFNRADSRIGTIAALGGTILLAVIVNLVEVGCTAILPVVFVSSLLSRYGSTIGAAHLLWTLLYGALYVLPMVLILVNFVFTFRSRRLTERTGHVLKGANALLMLLLGAYLLLGS